MVSRKIKYIILVLIVLFAGFVVYDTSSQPGVQDLKGGFKEAAAYRNENNTGPIIRIYAVTVKDIHREEMLKYGDLMPHTKYGNTKVYFFKDGKPAPNQLIPGDKNFDERFQNYVVAFYEKDANGQVHFQSTAP